MRNTHLATAIQLVMASPSPAQYLLSLHLISKTNDKFSYVPLIIDTFSIKQDFVNDYADSIMIMFEIASADYAIIQDNAQDLMAIFTITSLDRQGQVVYTPPPQQYTYRATIINPKDVRRQLSDVAQRTTHDTSIALRLVDQVVYELRHIQINGIYQATTIAGVITHLAQTFKFKTLHMVPPDNTHVYDHIIVPPGKGFSEIFNYLQDKYGVYMKGLNYYCSNNVLYVYPTYETAPVFPQTGIFYQADDGAYAGAPSFHKITGTTTEIVINRESQSQDLSLTSGENKGTAAMFLRASSLVDGVVKVDPKTGAEFGKNLAASIRLVNPRLATGTAHNSTYTNASDNVFTMASNLAAGQALMLQAAWAHAVPFMFLPGCGVQYSYDHSGTQMTQPGILEGAQYSLTRNTRVGAGMLFVSSGSVVLRLRPDAAVTG